MSSEKESKTTDPATSADHEDDDLDDLLDEFDEQILSKPPGSQIADNSSESATTKIDKTEAATLDNEFKHNIEDLVKDLNIEDPEAKAQFEQLIKQFEETHMEEAAKTQQPQNFDSVMKETMERLKNSGKTVDEQLKNDPSASNPEDLLSSLLAGLGGGSGDGDFDMSKLLTDMLEQLSSSEVLYEPIKDLNTKFPSFLKDKAEEISAEEHLRYTKQFEITKDILTVFDSPGYDNENPEHREKVNALLESLQELGNPPSELVGDEKDFPGLGALGGTDSGLDFNSEDLPKDLEKELEEGCKQA